MADKNRIRYASPGERGADTGNPRSGASLDTRHIAFLELFNSQVHYVVPCWQRWYCWGQSDIERLVDDLVTVAQVPAGSQAAHYGGTMLTWTSVNSSRDLKDLEWSASGSESTTIPNRSSKA